MVFGLFNKTPKKFIAHRLDPARGYYTDEIVPNSEADAKRLAQLADGEKIYFITYYEDGEPIENIVPASKKELWLNLKREHY